MTNVEQLGPHNRMTAEEALAFAARQEWAHVMIIGYPKNNDTDIAVLSSHQSRATSLWTLEAAKVRVLFKQNVGGPDE